MKHKIFFLAVACMMLLCGLGNTISAAEGALYGQFTVNSNGDVVIFSQGNLQYQASSYNQWRFGLFQHDARLDNNEYAASDYTGWIDLFGFGCNGIERNPWEPSTDYTNDYKTDDVTGTIAGTDYDWAKCTITNGGSGTWRMLSADEWNYILTQRPNADKLQGRATIVDTEGYVLLPDDWDLENYATLFTPLAERDVNKYSTLEEWAVLEEKGAVFLPATGYRVGTKLYSGDAAYGTYWTGDLTTDATEAQVVKFSSTEMELTTGKRHCGRAVRLVQDATPAQKEIYAVYTSSEDGKVMTLYYDAYCEARNGMKDWKYYDDMPASEEARITGVSKIVLDVSMKNARPTSTKNWFRSSKAAKKIENLDFLNTEEVTDMSYMFAQCYNLSSVDVSGFKTGNVTDMSHMFYECYQMKSLDLSGFNTEKVTDMSSMFMSNHTLNSLNVSSFNTANVTDMSFMFAQCEPLKSLDLSSFNTEKVTNMAYMFATGVSLTSLDLSRFKTDNVTKMNSMFESCYALASLDMTNFNTEKVTDMSYMFSNCQTLTELNLSHFNTANVTDMRNMFANCYKLSSLDVSRFNTEKVTTMQYMFAGSHVLTELDLSSFNTPNVTSMDIMFYECSSLVSLNISNFNTANVTTMRSMFSKCNALESLDLSHFNTENVTDMNDMFRECEALKSLDLSNFNTEKLTDMSNMFSGCKALTSVNLCNFNPQNVTEYGMYYVFYECGELTTIYCKYDWSTCSAEATAMFTDCTKLKGPNGTEFDGTVTDKTYARPDGMDDKPGYFTALYSVKLKAEHGTISVKEKVDLDKVVYGTVLHLSVMEDEGFELAKWENYNPSTGLIVTSDTTVTAVIRAKIFTVRFLDWDENLLKREDVEYGESATPPDDPERKGFIFDGWDTDEWQNVTRDLKVYATYIKEDDAIDEIVNRQSSNRKLIIDDQLYILRDGKTYTVTGQEVK